MGGGEKMERQLLDREVERREGMRGKEVPLFLFCEFKLYVKPFQTPSREKRKGNKLNAGRI